MQNRNVQQVCKRRAVMMICVQTHFLKLKTQQILPIFSSSIISYWHTKDTKQDFQVFLKKLRTNIVFVFQIIHNFLLLYTEKL